MERPLASTLPFLVPALAVAAVALVAEPPPARPVPRTLAASHGRAAATPWPAAATVYDEIGRRLRTGDVERARVSRTIVEEATSAGLDPRLVLAVIQVESGFNPTIVSPAGAVGLMQLLDGTLRDVLRRPADARDPVTNVRAGVRYLGWLVRTFGDLDLALMGYNAGPYRILKHLGRGGVPARLRGYPRDVRRELERREVRWELAIAADLRAVFAGRRPVLVAKATHGPAPLERLDRAARARGAVVAALHGGAGDEPAGALQPLVALASRWRSAAARRPIRRRRAAAAPSRRGDASRARARARGSSHRSTGGPAGTARRRRPGEGGRAGR